MVELAISGIRTLDLSQLQRPVRAEQAGDSAPTRKTTAGYTVSESLRRALSGGVQTELQLRESRRILRTGGAVLAEIRDALERIGQLAEQAAGGEADGAQLQRELERLVEEIERMLDSASVDGTNLFSDANEDQLAALYLGAVIAGKGDPEGVSQEQALDGLRQLMEQVSQGVPLDKAIQSLTNGKFTSLIDFQNQFASGAAPGLRDFLSGLQEIGLTGLTASPLMSLLDGMEGMNFDLLMGLFQNVLSVESPPESLPVEAAPEGMGELPAAGAAPETAAAAETVETADAAETTGAAGATGAAETSAQEPDALSTETFGGFQVTGRDLSGVSYDSSTGALTVGGEAEMTVQGTGEEVRLTGSGEITLQNADLSRLTVNTPEARVLSEGENTLAEVQMERGATLAVDGGGHLRIGQLRADGTNTLRLTGGAVTIEEREGEKPLTLPIVVDGPVSLVARAVQVTSPEGKALEPFDIVWKALLPNWSGITSMELEGRQTRQTLQEGDPARLWLNKEGFPAYRLMLEGRDKEEKTRVRYAYLRWEQRGFKEVTMYPNPFTVTGGEPGLDWVYEEGTRTLHILTDQVTAVSGGSGLDAGQEPFSGRIALADHIGSLELALDGVVCRVEDGRAFSLGRGNDVTLLLPGGTSSRFESGAGCSGISLGDGTSLRVGGGEDGDPGTITATVGASVRDTDVPILEASQVMEALSVDPTGEREGRRLWVRTGVSLQMGDETVLLPQFRLSSRALRLDKLNLEDPQTVRVIVDEDRRWVSQVQAIYDTLYDRLERSLDSLRSSRGPLGGSAAPVRSTDAAGTILEEMKRSMLLRPGHVIETSSPRNLRRKLLG